MANIYKCTRREPAHGEFDRSVDGIAILLKRSKVDGKLAISNAVNGELLWVTTAIQSEERGEDNILTVQTANSVYTFKKIGETV